MIISVIQTSKAELWELIIDLNVEKGSIISGETLVVTGKVVAIHPNQYEVQKS